MINTSNGVLKTIFTELFLNARLDTSCRENDLNLNSYHFFPNLHIRVLLANLKGGNTFLYVAEKMGL